jgi:hypothetical protein
MSGVEVVPPSSVVVRECLDVYANAVIWLEIANLMLRVLQFAKSGFLNAVEYAYRNTRVQFHPALYVVLYAGMFCALYAAIVWLISFVMPNVH